MSLIFICKNYFPLQVFQMDNYLQQLLVKLRVTGKLLWFLIVMELCQHL